MAFDNVRLPEEVERGAEGGPKFQTSITALGNGSEQRNVDWLRTRSSWDIGYGVMRKAEFEEIIKFFYARQGKARGFRFKDWADYSVTNQVIGTGNGVETEFQLVKTYTSLVTYTRVITRPVTGTLTIKVNGVVATGWTANYNTGLVTFTSPVADTEIITASFEFDFPARFDTDELRINMLNFNAASVPAIPVIEILE